MKSNKKIKLSNKQQEVIDSLVNNHGQISAVADICPFHPRTLKSLLDRGLIIYADDPCYGYHKYKLVKA